MDPTIAAARIAEAEAILALQSLCYRDEAALYGDLTIPPLTQTLDDLLASYRTQRILVARLGDEVVGSVRGRVDGETCHVGRLIVHPRLRRRGLGGRLMAAIEGMCPEAARFELFTGHRSDANLWLYRRLGYREFRREPLTHRLTLVFLEKVMRRKTTAR